MKFVIVVLLVAGGLAAWYYKPWERIGGEPAQETSKPQSSEPTKQFMEECLPITPPRVDHPKKYCRCLWEQGIRQPADALAKPIARARAARCL